MFPILFWLLIFISLICFWNFIWKRRNLPPGPLPLPIFGNTLTLARYAPGYEAYKFWSNKYGPIYTLWFGEDPIIIISDFECMRDTFVKAGEDYNGRHLMTAINNVLTATNGNYGVIRTEGNRWRTMRRFTLKAMRDLGMGRSNLEQKFFNDFQQLIAEPLIKQIKQSEDGSIIIKRIDQMIDILAGSTINQMLFGYPFNEEKLEDFYNLKETLEKQRLTITSIRGRLLMGMPWLRYFPLFNTTFKEFDLQVTSTYKFFESNIFETIKKRRENNNNKEEEEEKHKDLVNYFLDQMEEIKRNEENENNLNEFNIENLRSLCYDLFLAGQETICITLNFLLLYLLLDQRVQLKLQKELDDFKEKFKITNLKEKYFRMVNRCELPYTNAVINETQRLCNLLPLNLSHKTTKNVELFNKKIKLPKGIAIVPQISCVLYDEKIFPKPYCFIPERFISSDGSFKRIDEFIPFSLGKRQCLGESLAKMELFMFTTNFFSKFKIFPTDPFNPPTTAKQPGFGVFPYPFSCRIELRRRLIRE
ncbi:hypothetical protein Mgra_00001000 [Meloidogyne graminicola]|uniref:Cytochrome P450 n=1 Tax=Meloidogyne graminicola TaxID=189291 RepID=A0A8T0A0V3_9BILA|nr:hypothetical protein Mgra_00001000 [Meloidogyne graminicola]